MDIAVLESTRPSSPPALVGGAWEEPRLSAAQLWREILLGRWHLIDHVDSNGRRYVSPRERQVLELALRGRPNKAIAYELGFLPPPCVRTWPQRGRNSAVARGAIRSLWHDKWDPRDEED
jgi:hypothetical protein